LESNITTDEEASSSINDRLKDHTEPDIDAPELDKLKKVFRFSSDRIKLIDSRLKASSQRNFVQRLSLLFLYAHEIVGRDQVQRSELNAILNEASVYDPNARQWIANSRELIIEGDLLSLSVPGRELAGQFLAEVLASNVPNRWALGGVRQGRGPKSATSDDGSLNTASKPSRRRSGGISKKAEQWVSAWKALELPVSGHDVLKDRSLADRGIFGLWAIRRAVSDDGKVVSRSELAKFLGAAFEIFVEERSLERALRAKDIKDKVHNTTGTKFQILPPGMAHAEHIAGLASSTSSHPPSAD